MRTLPPLLLAVLLVLPGCTFERRPPVEGSDGAGDAVGESDAAARLEAARSFLEELQRVRSSDAPSQLERLIHPDAVLVVDGRPLAGGGADGTEAGGLALEGASWRIVLEDGSLPGPSVLFVLRYPASEGGGAARSETILLTRDDGRWGVRALSRAVAGSEGSPP